MAGRRSSGSTGGQTSPRRRYSWVALLAPVLFLCHGAAHAGPAPLRVGLRRSSYGLPLRNGDDTWWIARAVAFAAAFPRAEPAIIEIVSNYQADGSTRLEFPRPPSYSGPTAHMRFGKPLDRDHERSLQAYDAAGVRVLLQVEPGDADVSHCLEVVHAAFGGHPCVIGYGVDLEWYRQRGSPARWGRPAGDAHARQWMDTVAGFGPDRTLFLKHWRPEYLPGQFRHPRLWFLSDSQRFRGDQALLADFGRWHQNAGASVTGYQIGYESDRHWWSRWPETPFSLGSAVLRAAPSCGFLFWVDFTADQVAFGPPRRRLLASRGGAPSRHAAGVARASEWPLRPGELGLAGTVLEAEADGSGFVLLADSYAFAGGARYSMAPARRKYVRLAPGADRSGVSPAALPGRRVRVSGRDSGTGAPLDASWVRMLVP